MTDHRSAKRRFAASALGAAITCIAAITAARADSLVAVLGPLDAPRCWSRTYDAAHLSANPAQKVRSVRFDSVPRRNPTKDPLNRRQLDHEKFVDAKYTDVNFVMRDGQRGGQELICSWKAELGAVRCGGEADAGSLTVRLEPDGRMRVRIADGLRLNDDESKLYVRGRADQEFLLSPLPPGRCKKPEV
jgi:hypothetical protein